MRILTVFALISTVASALAGQDRAPATRRPQRQATLQKLTGLGTVVDLGLSRYYANRSPRGIAKEIHARGFNWVLAYGCSLTPQFAQAVRAEGMALGLQLWGTIIYSPSQLKPPPPDSARQIFQNGPQSADANPVVFCPGNEDFLEWYRGYARRSISATKPDFALIIEAFMGSWGGPGGADYGCFCDTCRQRFADYCSEEPGFPEFSDASCPRYWQRDHKRYAAWVRFRCQSTANYLKRAYAVIREEDPEVALAGSMLAIDAPDAINKCREWNGQDLSLIAHAAPWDLFLFQAHWPDWIRAGLPPRKHVLSYTPFLEQLRRETPSLHAGILTDSGSQPQMRRSMPWLQTARDEAAAHGFSNFGIYEYSISRFIYEERPKVIEVTPRADGLELVFSKRLAPGSATAAANYTLDDGQHPSQVSFDGGNIVTLRFADCKGGRTARLTLDHILDDEETFWFNSGKGPTSRPYPANQIEAASLVTFTIP